MTGVCTVVGCEATEYIACDVEGVKLLEQNTGPADVNIKLLLGKSTICCGN